MNELQIFNNEDFGEIRASRCDRSGEVLFCGSDVAKALGYASPANAITAHCKGITILMTPTAGGEQNVKFITEGDLFRLIVKSKLPSAQKFENWVFDEILPSIRKNGGCLTPDKIEEVLLNPDTIIKLATELKAEREQKKQLENIVIDKEFDSLLFPLSSEEFNQLRENIVRDGCLEPLVVWGEILVDGHNRYKICTENTIPFTTVSKEFSDRGEVIEFILRTQLGRRNLSDFHKNEIALRYKDVLAKKAKEKQGTRTDLTLPPNDGKVKKDKTKNRHKTSTDAELGKIAGTNETSIRRTKTILEKGTPEQIARVEAGGKGNSIK